MANKNWTEQDAHTSAHIGYALVYALLNALEKERPGLRKEVWEEAERSLREYDLLDAASLEWVRDKLASL